MKPVTEGELKAQSTGVRITEEELNNNIIACNFINVGEAIAAKDTTPVHVSHGLLTICVLVLANGFTVTGESACADPANFNREIGQRLAYNQAKGKIWALMGYELRSKLTIEQRLWLDGDARRNGAA